MTFYIVVFEGKVRGLYTCGADANKRVKSLGGGEVIVSRANADIESSFR